MRQSFAPLLATFTIELLFETTFNERVLHKLFRFSDGSPPYGLASTFKHMLAAAGLSKDRATGQQRTLYSLRHTYATIELMSGTDIHTLAL